jgi:glyoxylase-like metal-dependent hydrolase (beta-lactamase superfamily II)/rhodanese-related sulfurtransferase
VTQIVAFVDEGLGHSSHLIDLGDSRALVIDPLRIADEQRAYAATAGLEIAFAADTHTHADYVSGGSQLAARGATFLAPATARLEARHSPVEDGDTISLGRFSLRAIATPGHTPDHLAYLLIDGDEAIALFSGGSLMVGTVGRTDLAGASRTEELARCQYRSLRDRVLTLPDDLTVYPTHGQGSFCSAPGATRRNTTIGNERASNPLLQLDEDAFVEQLVASLGTLPSYFRRLPEVNRRGPRVYEAVPQLDRLSAAEVQRHIAAAGVVVDTRPIAAYATAHIEGSISNALRPAFATWLASVISADVPIVFVVDDAADLHDVVRQALNVGHERFAGVLEGGIEMWQTTGHPVAATQLVDAHQLDGRVVDVRQREEFESGHLPGASNIELGAIADADIASPVTLMCGHGERAMTAASLLARAGVTDLRVFAGGLDDWSRATRHTLESGT